MIYLGFYFGIFRIVYPFVPSTFIQLLRRQERLIYIETWRRRKWRRINFPFRKKRNFQNFPWNIWKFVQCITQYLYGAKVHIQRLEDSKYQWKILLGCQYSSYTGHQGAGMSVVIGLSLGTNTVVSTLYQYFDKYQINSNLKVSIILIMKRILPS